MHRIVVLAQTCKPAWWLAPQTRDDCSHAAGHGFFYYYLDIGRAVGACWSDLIVDHTPGDWADTDGDTRLAGLNAQARPLSISCSIYIPMIGGGRRHCLCVFCVGPLCGPPLRWWVLCGVLPSVWVPCGWGPPPVASSFHVASTRVMSRAHAPAPAQTRLGPGCKKNAPNMHVVYIHITQPRPSLRKTCLSPMQAVDATYIPI